MEKIIGRLSALFLFLLVGCGQKESISPQTDPHLKKITVKETFITLNSDESAQIHFTVEEASYAFSLGVGTPGSQLQLLTGSASIPAEVQLQSVTADAVPGSYTAVIADKGTEREYDHSLRLALFFPGTDSFIASEPFTVKSAPPAPGWLETGLPVLYVDTEGGQEVSSKTEYLSALLRIQAEESPLGETACSIRGRGNTTWEWPKKPYLIKLDKKESLLGMPKHKRWVLLANFCDRTLMRNLVSMKVSSMTRQGWTPRCESVELVMNGKHLGNYLLIEQVRVDKDRVAITEMTPEDIEGEALTGGYLLELDFHFDNEVQWIDPHGRGGQPGFEAGIPFGVKYPEPEDLAPSQLEYIKSYIGEAAGVLYGKDFADPEKGYAAYLDVDSFVDYWLVFEIMGNHELGNPGSIYFHKDRGGKLKAGPCWDFDWGVLSYKSSPQARTGLINRKAIWYSALFNDPSFRAKVKARFQELLPQLQTIPAYMDELQEHLKESARLNFKMWDPTQDVTMNGGELINGDENMSFDAAVRRLRDNYQERLQVIGKALEEGN